MTVQPVQHQQKLSPFTKDYSWHHKALLFSCCFCYFLTLKNPPKPSKTTTNNTLKKTHKQPNQPTHAQTGTPTTVIAGNSMPFYLELSEMPARNAEAVWEGHHNVLNGHNDPGRCQSCEMQVPRLRFAGAVWSVLGCSETGDTAIEKSGAITQTAGFCSCKGGQKVRNKNIGELTNLTQQQCLCCAGCQPVGSRTCALQAGPEPLFASGWNVWHCSHKVAWI